MVEGRDGTGFALEAVDTSGMVRHGGGQDLERDVAPELLIGRPVDLAHAAGPERTADLVVAEACAGGK
jgi:hypothetical protein